MTWAESSIGPTKSNANFFLVQSPKKWPIQLNLSRPLSKEISIKSTRNAMRGFLIAKGFCAVRLIR